jgi:hypothetical protein
MLVPAVVTAAQRQARNGAASSSGVRSTAPRRAVPGSAAATAVPHHGRGERQLTGGTVPPGQLHEPRQQARLAAQLGRGHPFRCYRTH